MITLDTLNLIKPGNSSSHCLKTDLLHRDVLKINTGRRKAKGATLGTPKEKQASNIIKPNKNPTRLCSIYNTQAEILLMFGNVCVTCSIRCIVWNLTESNCGALSANLS